MEPVLSRYPDFAAFLDRGPDPQRQGRLRRAESVGRPIGDAAFLQAVEAAAGRSLAPGKPGRKRSASAEPEQLELSALSP